MCRGAGAALRRALGADASVSISGGTNAARLDEGRYIGVGHTMRQLGEGKRIYAMFAYTFAPIRPFCLREMTKEFQFPVRGRPGPGVSADELEASSAGLAPRPDDPGESEAPGGNPSVRSDDAAVEILSDGSDGYSADGSRRRRGRDVDIPQTGRGDAAAATRIFRGTSRGDAAAVEILSVGPKGRQKPVSPNDGRRRHSAAIQFPMSLVLADGVAQIGFGWADRVSFVGAVPVETLLRSARPLQYQ